MIGLLLCVIQRERHWERFCSWQRKMSKQFLTKLTLARVLGDELALTFSGSKFSSAKLSVGDDSAEVAQYLRGLTLENHVSYLSTFGFQEKWKLIEVKTAKNLQKQLKIGYFLEICRVVVDPLYIIVIIHEKDRLLPTPMPVLKAGCDKSDFHSPISSLR